MVAPAGSIVKFFCILFLVRACPPLFNPFFVVSLRFPSQFISSFSQVDFTAVGASFLVSILAPAALSQLTGVLFVLMASMISGS